MEPISLLRKPVLVLNASYEPIHVCAARRALVLLFKGLAATEEAAAERVHSPTRSHPLPSVIRLLEYRRIPRQTRRFPGKTSWSATITPASTATNGSARRS